VNEQHGTFSIGTFAIASKRWFRSQSAGNIQS